MTAATTTLNLGTGGDKILHDTLTTADGAAAPTGAVAQLVKIGHGSAGDFKTTSAASPLPVAGVADTTAAGTLAALNATVALSLAGGYSAAVAQITGTWVGTITFEGTADGVNWVSINAVIAGTSTPGQTTAANGVVRLTPAGLAQFRVNMTAYTSGTATITLRATQGAGGTFLNQSLTAGSNVIGKFGIDQTTPGTTNAVAITADVGLVSTLNSSTSLLGISGVFTGTAEDLTHYPYICVTIFADQASATDGLSIQQSSNGTNWDVTDVYTIPANTGKTFTTGRTARYFRVVYTNGATAQTVCRMQTLFTRTAGKASSVRPQDARSNDNDFTESVAFGMVYNGTSWDRLRGTTAGMAAVLAAETTKVIGTVNVASAQTIATTNAGTFAVQATATLAAETTKVIGTVNIAAAQTLATVTTVAAVTAITNALPAGTNSIGTVQPPTLTKGTQGATGVSTQALKDAGRSTRTITLDSFAVAATTETLNTMSYSSDNGTLTTGTSYTVTTGKRLSVQAITVSLHTITGNTAGVSVIVRIRVNNAGAATVTSPVQMVIPLTGTAAANMATAAVVVPIPDGWEFAAGAGIGITTTCAGFVTTTAAPKVDIAIVGYEY